MIEIKIPKEINKYEAKAIGPFTLRQLICVLIGFPIGIGIFILTKPYVGTDMAGFFVLPIGGICYLFGWHKEYGLPFEKYLKTVFITSFLAPSKRLYKTHNFYSDILKEIEKEEAMEDEVLTDSKGKKKKPEKKKKYKRSKEAIR